MTNQDIKNEYDKLARLCLEFDGYPQILQFAIIGTMIDSYCCQHKLKRDIVISDLRDTSKEIERKYGKFNI